MPSPDCVINAADALSYGQGCRLKDAMLVAERKGWVNAQGRVPKMLLFDCTQRVEFNDHFSTQVFPTLLKQTKLWNFGRGLLVPVASHWLAMGFPHPLIGDVPEDLKGFFPFSPGLLQSGGDGDPFHVYRQRSLTGNAMHWAAISCWLTYVLAGTDKSFLIEQLEANQTMESSMD